MTVDELMRHLAHQELTARVGVLLLDAKDDEVARGQATSVSFAEDAAVIVAEHLP
jgi:hypothetical protein